MKYVLNKSIHYVIINLFNYFFLVIIIKFIIPLTTCFVRFVILVNITIYYIISRSLLPKCKKDIINILKLLYNKSSIIISVIFFYIVYCLVTIV